MTHEVFLALLLIVSLLTGLFTEGIKKLMEEAGKAYRSNIIAGAVAVILSVAIDAAYVITTETALNDKLAVYLIALV
ncbi:MAG: aminopeptidase, partial [Bacillota bacterium]|nr:aminopeptidase [Bacillota bacterium]